MTYDSQGRRILSNPLWKDYEFAEPAKGHPSTWESEVKQLRARVAELEAAVDAMNATTHIAHALEDGAIADEWAWVFEDIHREQIEALSRAALQEQEGGE